MTYHGGIRIATEQTDRKTTWAITFGESFPVIALERDHEIFQSLFILYIGCMQGRLSLERLEAGLRNIAEGKAPQ